MDVVVEEEEEIAGIWRRAVALLGGAEAAAAPARGRGGFSPKNSPTVFLSGQPVPPPDVKVTEAENKQVVLIKSQTIDDFPTRPGYGTRGTKIVVWVNMFELNANVDSGKTEVPLFKYNVDTGNDHLAKIKKQHLVHAILQRPEFQKVAWATDYANIIVTNQRLDSDIEGRVEVRDPRDDVPPGQSTSEEAEAAVSRRMQRFKVTYEDSFALSHLLSWLRRSQNGQMYEGRADLIQLLNIIVQKACRDDRLVSTGGQSGFFPIRDHVCFNSRDLGGGLPAYKGFFSSVRYGVGRILVNLNVAHGAFLNDQPLRGLIKSMCGGRNPVAGDKHALAAVEQKIRNLKVLTQYMRPRDAAGQVIIGSQPLRKIRTILRFSKTPAPKGKPAEFRYLSCKDTTFSLSTGPGAPGQTISVSNYFRQHHDVTLKFPDEPPMNVGTRDNNNWLPQELAIKVLSGPASRIATSCKAIRQPTC